MLSQAVIIQNQHVLMVRQYVRNGNIVWTFPGGKVEESESPEMACIREAKEETGYDIKIRELLTVQKQKYTFVAEIIGGELYLDLSNPDNHEIIEIAWVPIDNASYFDVQTKPILMYYFKQR